MDILSLLSIGFNIAANASAVVANIVGIALDLAPR